MYKRASHRVCIALILLSLSFSIGAKTRNGQAEALFQEGMTLYQQRYSAVAITPLEKAAKLGHAGAAYQVGEILRRRYTFITEEAEEFYRQAAEGGEVYAMLRLAKQSKLCGTLRQCDYDRERWLDLALETAMPRAKAGDTDAMMELFSVSWARGDKDKAFEWTENAARKGNALAQYWLAAGLLHERKMGFYWTEDGRRQDVFKWLIASAEQGYPKAMYTLAREYRRDGRDAEAMPWIKRMGQTDYFDALYEFGLVMVGRPHEGEQSRPAHEVVEGLATLFALHRQTGSSRVKESTDLRLPGIDPALIKEAQARSEELLVDTAILHYLPKFGI